MIIMMGAVIIIITSKIPRIIIIATKIPRIVVSPSVSYSVVRVTSPTTIPPIGSIPIRSIPATVSVVVDVYLHFSSIISPSTILVFIFIIISFFFNNNISVFICCLDCIIGIYISKNSTLVIIF